jgi:hypothetical protein
MRFRVTPTAERRMLASGGACCGLTAIILVRRAAYFHSTPPGFTLCGDFVAGLAALAGAAIALAHRPPTLGEQAGIVLVLAAAILAERFPVPILGAPPAIRCSSRWPSRWGSRRGSGIVRRLVFQLDHGTRSVRARSHASELEMPVG